MPDVMTESGTEATGGRTTAVNTEQKIQKLISLAIFREVEAYAFYREVAEVVHDEEVKKIFMDLAVQEQEHEDRLDRFRSDPASMQPPPGANDLSISEEQNLPMLTCGMQPVEAITLAMKKEQQASEFYQKLSEMADDPDLGYVCETLSAMEIEHKNALEKIYMRLVRAGGKLSEDGW